MAIYHIQNYKGLKLLRSPPEKFGELTNENFKLLAKNKDSTNTELNGLKARVEAIEDSYVISVNDIAGEVDIVGAGGILVSTSGQTITISGGGGGTSIHNSLLGLQGGTTNQYYHLTQSQYNDYIGSTEVANISAYLQTQIDNITGAGGSDAILIGGSGISVVESPVDTWTISVSGDYASTTLVSNISGNLQAQIDAISTASVTGSLLQGSVPCVTGSYIYVISHDTIDTSKVYPFVSLTVPSTGSLLYVEGIYDRQPEQFTVILSDKPETAGYEINWLLPVAANVTGGGTTIHNELTGLQGGTINEYYHLTFAEYSDYIGSTEVANISAYLQSQIDAISGGSGSDSILIGGLGISVVESPLDTWTISVSGDYATNSYVETISGNLRSDIDTNTSNIQNNANDIAVLQVDVSNLETVVSNVSGNLQGQIDAIVEESTSVISSGGTIDVSQNGYVFNVDVSDYISKTEVSNISGYLQTQIDNITGSGSGSSVFLIGGDGISVNEGPLDTWTISVSGDYATNSLVENISANLQSQIDAISGGSGSDAVLIGGSGIQVVESPADTWTINVTGDYISGTEVSNISGYLQSQISSNDSDILQLQNDVNSLESVVSNVSGNLQGQIDAIVEESTSVTSSGGTIIVSQNGYVFNVDVSDYISKTEVSNISGYLQTQIDNISGGNGPDAVLIGGSGIQVVESPADTWTISVSGDYALNSDVAALSASIDSNTSNISSLQTQVDSMTGNLYQGSEPCVIGQKLYTITHGSVDTTQIYPHVSLVVPTSGSTLYIAGILNQTSTNFQVVLSGTPSISGYFINWLMIDSIYGGGSGGGAASIEIVQVSSLTTLNRSENQYVGVLSGQLSGDGGFYLPSSPQEGDKIELADEEYLANTYNVDISGNGNLINEDSVFTMNQNGQSFYLRYAHGRWRIF